MVHVGDILHGDGNKASKAVEMPQNFIKIVPNQYTGALVNTKYTIALQKNNSKYVIWRIAGIC